MLNNAFSFVDHLKEKAFCYVLMVSFIALDKRWYQFNFSLFLHKNIYYGYSLEAPHRGASNEYPQYTFSKRNKKNINSF